MKKRNKILLLMVGAFFTTFFGIQNVFASTLNFDFSGYYYERGSNSYAYSSWKLENYYVDGNVAYCIEPGVAEGTNQYTSTTFDDYSKLSTSVKDRVKLIAYYGYSYIGHQTQKYRAATQSLIWKTIMGDGAWLTYTTGRYGTGTSYDVSYEESVIESLVASHYTKPSFNGGSYTSQVGTSITLTDTNGVLSNYEVYASNDAEITISGNKLTITPTKIGTVTLKFVKKQIYSKTYLVYTADGYQDMIATGNVDPVYFSVTLTGLGGKVEMTKVDSDTNTSTAQGEATLEGATYGIYDDSGNLIQTITTDSTGYAISDYLPSFGDYYIQEITPSTGYELDTTKYYFESSSTELLSYVKTKEQVIKRDVEITKVYADDTTGIMTPEVGVEFGFYDKDGNLYTTATTDSNGKAKVTLVYGTYTVKQLSSSSNTEKVKDFTIVVSESGDTFYYTIANAEITARLKVIKVDADTGEVITGSNIKFMIYNVDTGEYVSQTITYPTAETLTVFETDLNGVLITPYPLDAGNYELIEVDQVIDGYLWNDTPLAFTIDENSELTYDEDYGTLVVVKFENTSVKGSVEITKLGEEVELTEDGYVYTSITLEGVKIGLYANEDIYDALGNLIYEKDTLIGEYLTDENGNIKIDDLYLGSYYIQEIETVLGHVLDTTKYTFSLEYIDQYTAVVTYSITLENHLPKGTLEFTKTDFSTSETLPNTKIEIYTEDDELVFSGYTDENGKIVIDELPVGKYYILEVEAPDGYELNTEKMYFEITEDGEVVKCTMTDELIITEVPNTEEVEFPIFELISLLVCCIGIGVVIYVNKNKTK